MDVTTFIERFAESFQKFMEKAQLSSSISMVIDESMLTDLDIKPSVLRDSVSVLLQDLQTLHNMCDSSNSDEVSGNTPCPSSNEQAESPKTDPVNLDPEVVQITADSKEIYRRIQAFIDRKQIEKDDTNRREFCTVVPHPVETSCARTDAVFTSKTGGKSHVKVSKVINKYGPQTRPALITVPPVRSVKRDRTARDSTGTDGSSGPVTGIEERLHNMESFLKIKKPGQKSSEDVFQRLKQLEGRLLHLESISPEYTNISSSLAKSQRGENKEFGQDSAVHDIDLRIKELQRSLRMKKARIETMAQTET